ncbi:hypothetical protein HDU97_006199 [Phlyctochytrium planicorne]|nr:hypothetical protein HDU97_006199 [Phlyctochytrium planicorne]
MSSISDITVHSFASQHVRLLASDREKRLRIVETIQNGKHFEGRSFGAVVLIDISGYSKLTSALAAYGKVSSELITIAVKSFMNKIIEVVVRYGGDVVRFLGDALLVVFRGSTLESERKVAMCTALKCCLDIMINHPAHVVRISSLSHVVAQTGNAASEYESGGASGTFAKGFRRQSEAFDVKAGRRQSSVGDNINALEEMGVDPCLRLHVAITAGIIADIIIGTNTRMDHVVYGECFQELNGLLSSANRALEIHTGQKKGIKYSDGIVLSNPYFWGLFNILPSFTTLYYGYSGSGDLLSSESKLSTSTEALETHEFIEKFVNASIITLLKSNHSGALRKLINEGYQKNGTESDGLSQYRQITVIFVKLLADFDQEMAQQAFKMFVNVLEMNEGVFQQFAVDDKGQTMLACYGLPPWTHSDDCSRAISTATTFYRKFKACPVAISVASGTILFTRLGNEFRSEASLLGDVVNQAARLLGIATEEDPIVCDSASAKYGIGSQISLLGSFHLKGNLDDVDIWAIDPDHTSTLQSIPQSIKTFGYKPEKDTLLKELEQWNLDNDSRTVLVEGPSGMGKSTLMDYFHGTAKAQGINRICLSRMSESSRYIPFSGIQTAVSYIFQDFSNDAPRGSTSQSQSTISTRRQSIFQREEATAVDSILEFLETLNEDRKHVPLLGIFFPFTRIPENDYTMGLSVDARNKGICSLTARIICLWSRNRKPVLIFDDMQWMDSFSVQIIGQVIMAEPRMFTFLCSRPITESKNAELIKIANDFKGTHLVLNGFTEADIAEYLLDVYNGEAVTVDKSVLSVISKKTLMNPFIVQILIEIIRQQRSIVVDSLGKLTCKDDFSEWVDKTISNQVMIQFDQLSIEFQNLLRHACVFGQYFHLPDVARIMPGNVEISSLIKLIDSDDRFKFVRAVDESGNGLSFYFRHIIICTAIYDSISYSQKNAWHSTVGKFLESSFDQYPLMVVLPSMYYHFCQTSMVAERIRYGERLGLEYYRKGFRIQALEILKGHVNFVDSCSNIPDEFSNNVRRAVWYTSLADVGRLTFETSLVVSAGMRGLQLLGLNIPPFENLKTKHLVKTISRQCSLYIRTNGGRTAVGRRKVDTVRANLIDLALTSILYLSLNIPQNRTYTFYLMVERLNNSIVVASLSPVLWAKSAGMAAYSFFFTIPALGLRYFMSAKSAWQRCHPDDYYLSQMYFGIVAIRLGYDMTEHLDKLESIFLKRDDNADIERVRTLKLIQRYPKNFDEIHQRLKNIEEFMVTDYYISFTYSVLYIIVSILSKKLDMAQQRREAIYALFLRAEAKLKGLPECNQLVFVSADIWTAIINRDLYGATLPLTKLAAFSKSFENPMVDLEALLFGGSSLWIVISLIELETPQSSATIKEAAIKGIVELLHTIKKFRVKTSHTAEFLRPYSLSALHLLRGKPAKSQKGLESMLAGESGIRAFKSWPWLKGLIHAAIWLLTSKDTHFQQAAMYFQLHECTLLIEWLAAAKPFVYLRKM